MSKKLKNKIPIDQITAGELKKMIENLDDHQIIRFYNLSNSRELYVYSVDLTHKELFFYEQNINHTGN